MKRGKHIMFFRMLLLTLFATAALTGQTFAPLHVLCGNSTPFTDAAGNSWVSDTGLYSLSKGVASTTHAITKTTNAQQIYQIERYGAAGFQYQFNVPAGFSYTVTLHFSENYFTASNKRVFNVAVNGQGVLNNFDIFTAAGGQYTASDQTVVVPASAGTILILFTPVINFAKIDSIEISQGTQPVPPPPPPPPSQAIVLPLEIMGPAGYTQSVTFNLDPSANLTGVKLWLQIHGLKYESEASMQVNNSAWLPINTSTVSIAGYAAKFGGIGGGFATLKMTLPLTNGALVAGANTITFRFNASDGVASGYRILNFNVLASDGTKLLPQSTFTADDPSKWKPPLNTAADIQAGQALWTAASLVTSSGPIQAHCGDCHTQDGRDLKYFNYSNYSIRVRSVFHGLTSQQGDQIASYIRSLNVPAPSIARPWNPPYQPGPGLSAQSVQNWAAGAGIDAVLDHDSDMLPYLMPNGSTANLAWNAYLNVRDIPIPLQLLDWNRWLPIIHPIDAFGTAFTTGPQLSMYLDIRSKLIPGDFTAATKVMLPDPLNIGVPEYFAWQQKTNAFDQTLIPSAPSDGTINPAWNDPILARRLYSNRQWEMTKLWEINQEFGLEGMSQQFFGTKAPDRAWVTGQPFFTSPNFMHIPGPNPGIANGTKVAHTYLSFIWYQLQLILHDGNGSQTGSGPVDWAYYMAYPEGTLTWDDVAQVPRVGSAGLLLESLAKALQASAVFGVTPNPMNISSAGNATPLDMVSWPALQTAWFEVPDKKLPLLNMWIGLWLSRMKEYTTDEMFNTVSGVTPMAGPTFQEQNWFTGMLVFSLAAWHFEGADPSLLTQVATWAATIWPTYDWQGTINRQCQTMPDLKCMYNGAWWSFNN